MDLDAAVDMIADRLIRTREETWEYEDEGGRHLHRTLGFVLLGGATLDNEEDSLIKKFFTTAGAGRRSETARSSPGSGGGLALG